MVSPWATAAVLMNTLLEQPTLTIAEAWIVGELAMVISLVISAFMMEFPQTERSVALTEAVRESTEVPSIRLYRALSLFLHSN